MSVDGARRAEILQTAARLFGASGLRTSLKDIADACGILPGSLYHHFESKEALIVELIDSYRAELDALAEAALDALNRGTVPVDRHILEVSTAIAECAVRNRAAMLLTFYEPPSGAGDELTDVAANAPLAIGEAMAKTLGVAQDTGYLREGIDVRRFADRMVQVMQHISLGVFDPDDMAAARQVATIRTEIQLTGVATDPPPDRDLDRSDAFAAARQAVAAWPQADDARDERMAKLRAAARQEFGRRGYEATTVRDIAAAAEMSTGSVYRLIGSKDELLSSIMRSFAARVRDSWKPVLETSSSTIEKLDALTWIDINVVDRFSDEYNIELAWIRESPPDTPNLGRTFAARLRDVKTLVTAGRRAGELRLDGPNADMRAWALFELLWMPENLVRPEPRDALALGRDTVLRGAADRQGQPGSR